MLMGGASIQVVLRGVASKSEETNKEKCKILAKLAEKEARVSAEQVIDEILRGIRTPER